MYWHLKEFDALDHHEEIDLVEKHKRKKKTEEMHKKFRDMPESEHIRNYKKYEKIN